MKKILFLFLLIFYFSFCENYYVSPSGDDKNPGTKEKPFRTIQKAAGIVNPGDTIFILPGEYDEKVDILRSGEKDKYIKFKGEGNREEIKVKGF
ncbi:MAG: DUF1565 domain-containing protein, partial [bacterium]|nr:DUF1565 domain-containing protein [bacterium]